jgi:hypothetical protein
MVPSRRLATLFDQARRHQQQSCLYHEDPDPASLYTDHECASGQFPSVTTHILADHTDEVWRIEWSPDGMMLASAGKDRAVVIWQLKVDPPLFIPVVPPGRDRNDADVVCFRLHPRREAAYNTVLSRCITCATTEIRSTPSPGRGTVKRSLQARTRACTCGTRRWVSVCFTIAGALLMVKSDWDAEGDADGRVAA